MKYILLFTLLFFSLATQAQKKKKKAITSATTLTTLTTKQLTPIVNKLQAKVDSAAYLNPADFEYNPDTKTYSIKRDTIIIKRGAYIMVEPQIAHANQFIPIDTALRDIPKAYNLSLPQKDQKDQDIADLNWQVEYLEELLDDREKIIDKLQKIIKDLQKQKN